VHGGGQLAPGGAPSAPSRLGPRCKVTVADFDAKQQARATDPASQADATRADFDADRRRQEKKRQWLEERQKIEERGERRKQVADALEDAPAELKKMIAPMFHIRIVEKFLWDTREECLRRKESFVETLRTDPKVLSELENFADNYRAGGEARMEDLERQMQALERARALEEEKKQEVQPAAIDVHTLKELLEYAQQCRFEGNEKFKEGLYEDALFIYTQGDEVMKQWRVDGENLKNERKWLMDNHLTCLKNKSQAALNLELFQTALEAADAALAIDEEDHKAWYRKVQAQKGLGNFKGAEESLARLEDVAQWCPDRRRILRDCDTERRRLKIARAKHRSSTQEMLGRAFEAGVFSLDRERELEEASKALEGPPARSAPKIEQGPAKPAPQPIKAPEEPRPLERKITLTARLAGDLMDELAEAYAQKWFQARVRKCARDSGFERSVFLMRLKDVAFRVQKPVLEKWGFEGTEQGVREMTAAIRDHAANGDMPEWLKAKQDRCLELLYGGKEGGMLDILTQ